VLGSGARAYQEHHRCPHEDLDWPKEVLRRGSGQLCEYHQPGHEQERDHGAGRRQVRIETKNLADCDHSEQAHHS
jgi:hypothetical protein